MAGMKCCRDPGLRVQNPHMHLVEAFLALDGDAGGDAAHQALDIAAFVVERFVDEHAAVSPRQSAWMASRTSRTVMKPDITMSGSGCWAPVSRNWHSVKRPSEFVVWKQRRRRLYEQALTLTERDGRIALAHTPDGEVFSNVQRCWSQTEALKAHVAMARRGDRMAGTRISGVMERLFRDHLTGALPGGWVDQRNLDGQMRSQSIPASTGYHIVLAFAELIAFSKGQ